MPFLALPRPELEKIGQVHLRLATDSRAMCVEVFTTEYKGIKMTKYQDPTLDISRTRATVEMHHFYF